jgi:hypothetical protein
MPEWSAVVAGKEMARTSYDELVMTLVEDGSTQEYLSALADSHDELLEACGSLMEAINIDLTDEQADAIERGRAAIAKGGGGRR